MVLLGSMTEVETSLVSTFCVEAGTAKHFTPEEMEEMDAAAERAARAHETGHVEEDHISLSDEATDETLPVAAPAAREAGAAAPETAPETALKVAGMVSQADAERVEGALLALAGVRSVSIDLQAGLVTVSGSFPAAGVLIEAAAAAGYAATERRLAGGMFKFDSSEVDVEGGAATADEFMDAFGF
jgi:copper chaperone CopZ